MDPQKITELANLFRYNGDKILNSEFTLTLSGSLLRALNDSFTLIADSVEAGGPQQFQVTKPMNSKSPVFRDLQLVHDFVQKTTILCIIQYPTEDYFTGKIDISKFRSLKRLEIRKVNVRQVVGIQPLRAQLQQLICIKSLESVDEIITNCGGDSSNGFVWNELKNADFSYNNLQTVDSSLEFAQYLQQLNLRHNKLYSVEALKWLPHLKSLDLSYNCLQCIPQFHIDAYKRLQTLNMSNNFVEDLVGISKMDALTELDLSDNCLLDHTTLLPVSALMTLKYLNLYGNPLHCHPKHRLATAQFLHKNTSTVKFLLDLEPLSKNEKAITGKQQIRYAGSLNRFAPSSSSTSINLSNRPTPNSQTPASSVGSLRSFKLQDSSEISKTASDTNGVTKKKTSKIRMVEIEDEKPTSQQSDEKDKGSFDVDEDSIKATSSVSTRSKKKNKNDLLTQSLLEESNTDHLEAKKHIETLRGKYGVEWLQSGNAEMIHSVLGIDSNSSLHRNKTEKEREVSRALINDYLGKFSVTSMEEQPQQNFQTSTIRTSTPINTDNNPNLKQDRMLSYTPTKTLDNMQNTEKLDDNTLYLSVDNTETTLSSSKNDEKSFYQTANDSDLDQVKEILVSNEKQMEEDEKEAELRNVYPTSANAESEDSENEEEETYIVYTDKSNTALFLTLSENFLREKDTWTQRTKTKWSLKILESCERIKANTIRIHFDTVKSDKKERIYTVEDGLCQELEKKLREILSKRDLSEMNQTIYRCVNCSCQFSRENKISQPFPKQDLRCPDCNSTFIAEIHDIPKSLERTQEKTLIEEKLSPAAIVEESPVFPAKNLVQPATSSSIQPQQSVDSMEGETEYSNSIGSSRLTTINTTRPRSKSKQAKKSSANSLNESSSCSKISAHSQSSFDSNQSVVGSTNSERDLEFNVNCESDVDIISNPSQSSIEVLDQMYYDGRISQQPNLETIDDNSFKQTYVDWSHNMTGSKETPSAKTVGSDNSECTSTKKPTNVDSQDKMKSAVTSSVGPLGHVLLTESSSSGSVTDSVCTAYPSKKSVSNDEKIPPINLTTNEPIIELTDPTDINKEKVQKSQSNGNAKKEDASLTSMFGAIFQSTNILMTSSKKLIDAEKTAKIKSGEKLPSNAARTTDRFVPYKFNYTDFNDIDHRLKLYFYQNKFEDEGEHFKWLVRGRIYNENTKGLHSGIVAMSTSRLYLMEAFAPENDVITKWLKPIVSVSMDRLESVQLLPWKIGCSFKVRNWGGFLLLLQDILHTDSLLLYFANNNLPIQCELLYQPSESLSKRLNDSVSGEKINMFALLNGCEISCDNAKRTFQICGLITTDTHLYLTTGKLTWLSEQTTVTSTSDDFEVERCLTQLMSNLVDIEQISDYIRVINFLDDTQDKCEIWKLTFETKGNAECTLNAIGQAWQKLFGVSLFGT